MPGAGTLAFNKNPFNMSSFGAANGATIVVGATTLQLAAGPSTNNGTLMVSAGGTILTNNAALTNAATGVIGGSGTVVMGGTNPATFVNNGTIAPGGVGTIGTLAVQGDMSFGPSATLALDMRDGSCTTNWL